MLKQATNISLGKHKMGDTVFGRFSVAIVTPFCEATVDENQSIDKEGLESVITHVANKLEAARRGSDVVGGIIVSGSTGEQHTMTVEERIELYRLTVSTAKCYNVPVAAGVAATTTHGAVNLAKAAVDAGCEGIMLGLPPYCRLLDEEIRAYIMAVREAVGSSIPILLYNNSMRNGYGPSLSLIAELCRSGILWGVKHAPSPDVFMEQAQSLLELEPRIRLYTGSDKMSVDLLSCGEQPRLMPSSQLPYPRFYGLTSIIGNLFPRQSAQMVCNLTSGDAAKVKLGELAHAALLPVLDATLLGASLPAGLKYAMRNEGIGAGYTRLPVGFLSPEKQREITDSLQGYHLAGKI